MPAVMLVLLLEVRQGQQPGPSHVRRTSVVWADRRLDLTSQGPIRVEVGSAYHDVLSCRSAGDCGGEN